VRRDPRTPADFYVSPVPAGIRPLCISVGGSRKAGAVRKQWTPSDLNAN